MAQLNRKEIVDGNWTGNWLPISLGVSTGVEVRDTPPTDPMTKVWINTSVNTSINDYVIGYDANHNRLWHNGKIDANIGESEDLTTTEKGSLVGAINENANAIQTNADDIAELQISKIYVFEGSIALSMSRSSAGVYYQNALLNDVFTNFNYDLYLPLGVSIKSWSTLSKGVSVGTDGSSVTVISSESATGSLGLRLIAIKR